MPWCLTSKETLEDITREANPRLGTCCISSPPRNGPPSPRVVPPTSDQGRHPEGTPGRAGERAGERAFRAPSNNVPTFPRVAQTHLTHLTETTMTGKNTKRFALVGM